MTHRPFLISSVVSSRWMILSMTKRMVLPSLSSYVFQDYGLFTRKIRQLPFSGASDKPCGNVVQILTQDCRQTILKNLTVGIIRTHHYCFKNCFIESYNHYHSPNICCRYALRSSPSRPVQSMRPSGPNTIDSGKAVMP